MPLKVKNKLYKNVDRSQEIWVKKFVDRELEEELNFDFDYLPEPVI
jgi:hypothetical protein